MFMQLEENLEYQQTSCSFLRPVGHEVKQKVFVVIIFYYFVNACYNWLSTNLPFCLFTLLSCNMQIYTDKIFRMTSNAHNLFRVLSYFFDNINHVIYLVLQGLHAYCSCTLS